MGGFFFFLNLKSSKIKVENGLVIRRNLNALNENQLPTLSVKPQPTMTTVSEFGLFLYFSFLSFKRAFFLLKFLF